MEKFYKKDEEEKELAEITVTTKVSNYESKADQIYDEVERMGIMIKSEGLASEINLLLIWGTKFPRNKEIAENVIHYAKLQIDSLASKGKYRVIYFHSGIKGAGSKIPKMIK